MALPPPAPAARPGRPVPGAALAPLLGFVVLLAAVFAVSYAAGTAAGPAAPGWHRTGGGGPGAPGGGAGDTGRMSGMDGS
ncbi:hypothetical protein [Streptomyces tremellae]|uniref:Uncharacterized protein n=1 Tax=Streptomyces tremellae TaxID=1124239 RepID=A0ABP7FHF6_9ACTN